MALSAADLERARQIAANAPPLTTEQRDRLRALLSGCEAAQPAPVDSDQDGTADAA
jgi:hypothetical protein